MHQPSFTSRSLKSVIAGVFVFQLGTAVFVPVQEARAEGVMQSFEKEVQGVLDHSKDSVVRIKVLFKVADAQKGDVITEALSFGTGFFIDNKGYILTAASVLRGSSKAVVYWKDKPYEAQSIGQDPRTNLALLKIDAETPVLPVGDPDAVKMGSMVIAVGFPADSPIAAEYGNVSNVNAAQNSGIFAIPPIRSSMRVQPGQSGSPFLNSKGELIGMIVCVMQDGSSTFALPITAAQKIKNDFMRFGAARHGWTGLTIEVKNNPVSANEGIAIRDVFPGYPGQLAGIKTGDTLLKIGKKDIRTPADVMHATFYLSVGENVDITIKRDGETRSFPLKVAPRPTEKELMALKPQPVAQH